MGWVTEESGSILAGAKYS